MKSNRLMRKSTAVFAAVVALSFVALSIAMMFSVSIPFVFAVAALYLLPPAITAWYILSLVLDRRAFHRESAEAPALKIRLTVATILLIFMLALMGLLIGFFVLAVMFM